MNGIVAYGTYLPYYRLDRKSIGEALGSGGGKGGKGHTFVGVAGNLDGMPRGFTFAHGGSTSAVLPHGIPRANGAPSMVGFGALAVDAQGTLYAGERDRIARLIELVS